MKKLQTLLLSSLITINLAGQTLKTFNGDYENGEIQKGKATYTYYEDKNTMEYIKHGQFKYTLNVEGEYGGTYSELISGNYINGKKDGQWNYTINKKDNPSSNGAYYTGTIILSINYKNGIPNGTWTYKSQLKHRNFANNKWTDFINDVPEQVNAVFQNGVLIGQINFTNSPLYSEYNNITGQFNNNGFLDGKWIFKSSEKEKILEFKSGILKSFIIRNITNGKIINRESDNEELGSLKDNFLADKISANEVREKGFRIDTISAIKNELYDFSTSFNMAMFRFRYISGDDSYFYKEFDNAKNDYNQETSWFDSRNYGKIIEFKKNNYSSLESFTEFITAKEYEDKGNIILALKFYKSIIDLNKNLLSPEDVKIVEDKIAFCNKKIQQEKITKEFINPANESLKKITNWDNPYSFTDYAINAVNLYNQALKNPDISDSDKESITINLNKCKEYISNSFKFKEESSKLNKKQKTINENVETIKQTYEVTSNSKGMFAKKKEILFAAYNEIYGDLAGTLFVTNELDKKSLLMDKIINLQSKMLTLINENTKNIEKQLKSATNLLEKMQILGL